MFEESSTVLEGDGRLRKLPAEPGVLSKADAGLQRFELGRMQKDEATCFVIMVMAMVMMVAARTQTAIALSSTEAEWYAGTSGAAEGLYLIGLLKFLGIPLDLELYMDSSGSRGVAGRQGVGRIRSLEVRTLWLQQRVKDGEVVVKSVKGTENPADVGTKPLAVDTLKKMARKIGLVHWDGRAVRAIA